MLARICNNPNSTRYGDYGARGIKVCKRWSGTDGRRNFEADLGPRPIGKTLDRIRVNGNYTPSNCRWADGTTQRLNRRDKIQFRKAA